MKRLQHQTILSTDNHRGVIVGYELIKTVLLTQLKLSPLIKHFLNYLNTHKLQSCKSECPLERDYLITIKPPLFISK